MSRNQNSSVTPRENDPKYHNLTTYLKHFKTNDKPNVLKMLATIGLETLLNDEMECNLINIKRYFESSNRILAKLQQQNQPNFKKQHHQMSTTKQKRFSRADVISHFPFMDEFGGVDEIFQEGTEKISATSLDGINLRHYIEKIFNEFKIGPKGMRSADIPSALEILNLPSHSHPSSVPSWAGKKVIPFSQWDQIVRSIIESLRNPNFGDRSGRREDWERPKRTDFLDARKRPNSAPPRSNKTNETETHNFDSRRRISNEVNSLHSADREDERYRRDEWKDENSVSEIDGDEGDVNGGDNGGDTHRNGRGATWDPIKKLKSQMINQGKIQSHRAEILADKNHWKRIHSKEDQTALSSIASIRLQQYLETPFLRNSSQEHEQRNSESYTSSLPSQRKKKIIPKDSKILSSGSSSLEIANAFLQSHLGQDLVQNYHHSEPHDQDFHPNHEGEEQQHPFQGKRRGAAEERESGREEDKEFYKSYYSQDWQSRKGGWVGDFGPPHTHPLSIRKERETSFNIKKY